MTPKGFVGYIKSRKLSVNYSRLQIFHDLFVFVRG